MPGLPTSVLMFISYRYAESQVLEAIAAAGFTDISLAQARVCARIGPQGTRLTDLAEQAQVSKQSAGALVDQLERNGYVARMPDPSDARARLVTIAARGTKVQKVARVAEQRVEAQFAQRLGRERMELLSKALEDLRDVTDAWR